MRTPHKRVVFGLLVMLAGFIPVSCLAETAVSTPSETTAAQPDSASVSQQLKMLQQKMEQMQQDYNQRLQQMQTTINTLTAKISNT